MTLRSHISGTFDNRSVGRLSWPVAWNRSVSEANRQEQEADLGTLVEEIRAALVDGEIDAVEVENGEIVALIQFDDEEFAR